MVKTAIEKTDYASAGVAVFKVTGTLGFHENTSLEKFFAECRKKSLSKLVLDFTTLVSLGGGCARIIREAADKYGLQIAVVGAKATALRFLRSKGTEGRLLFAATVAEAVAVLEQGREGDGEPCREQAAVIEDDGRKEAEPESKPAGPEETPTVIALGLEPGEDSPSPPATSAAPGGADVEEADERELRKKLVQYNTLFNVGSELNRCRDKAAFLDAFLLTIIAQIGVESAAFLEKKSDGFVALGTKGVSTEASAIPTIPAEVGVKLGGADNGSVFPVEKLAVGQQQWDELLAMGFSYAAPFVIQDETRALVLLGKPIKQHMDSDWTDFLKMLMSQAAVAYENTSLMEEESERTLGLVQTLISLIEENTMAKGNTDMVSNYVYAVATAMHYPEEHLRDLIYGTVLRDIGMIKVSDLIVRSPRELVKEEWEIVKRHPVDGAEMLRKMKFSGHTVAIVLNHHERFNGEGYPSGLDGRNIPLGARIVSVVESYAAMIRDRPNRPALTKEEALGTLRENWGMRYDPEVVKSFVAIVEEEIRTGVLVSNRDFDVFKGKGS